MSTDRPALIPWVSVDRLRGVGPRLREALEEHGAARVVDLLLHLPSRYEDRTQRVPEARVFLTWDFGYTKRRIREGQRAAAAAEYIFFRPHLHARQNPDHLVLDVVQQVTEHLE